MVLRTVSEFSEYVIQKTFSPLNHHLGTIGKLLLVSTFIEDSLRILFQWNEQLEHLHFYRQFSWDFSGFFLGAIVFVMLVASSAILVSKKFVNLAAYTLIAVIALQGWGYGLYSDISYIFRGLSLAGSLILLMAQGEKARLIGDKRLCAGGLPMVYNSRILTYYPLFGRILLILLFLAILMAGEWSTLRVTISVLGLLCCVMVALGFKAKTTAALLIALLSVSNVLLNNWWSLHDAHPDRDYIKYDFFQTLSIIGGYLLLAEQGPGSISMDEVKRQF